MDGDDVDKLGLPLLATVKDLVKIRPVLGCRPVLWNGSWISEMTQKT